MEDIKKHFVNNLAQMRREIESYADESNLEKTAGSVTNTPVVLVMHVCGNLKHNIGATLGKTGFVRNRDAEFVSKGISREALLKEIDSTLMIVEPVLNNLSAETLGNDWPDESWGKGESVAGALLRIGVHLGYHLGQINYHRRLVDK